MGKRDNYKQNSKLIKKVISLFFLILVNISFSTLKAEVVNEIVINGNQKISDETIIIYGDIKKNLDYSDKDLNKILKNLYETNFFENVSINLNNNKLVINLIEYKTVNELTIIGEKSKRYKKEIKKILKLKEKNPFIKSFLADDISLIKKLYSSLGYNFVEIETKVKDVENNRINLIIDIERGPQSKISSIKFIGDKKVRDKRLRDVIVSEENKFWKVLSKNTKFNQNLLELDVRLLKNYYKSIGYYEVKVESQSADIDDKGNVEILYSITAGNRYIISKISTNPDPVFKKDIFQTLNNEYRKVIGEYYSPFTVKKLLEAIDELIENNNLQFVEHNVEESITSEGIEITFNIFEGERTLVERINIFGNNITDEKVIRGELLLDEGDPFTDLSLEKSISRIKARNIFGTVNSKVKEGSEKSLKIIDINVEERPTGEISAGAGIGTDGGTIAFNISENNWLGEGKRVNFGLELDSESVSGIINYTNPNYDFLGKSLNYFLESTSNDKPDQGFENTVISAGIGTSFEQYKDIFVNLGLSSSFDDLRTDGSASDSLKKQSGEFTEVSANYGFRYDKRNRAFMPTSGSVFGFNQSIPVFADRPFIGNTLSLSSYKEITEDVVGTGKFYFSSINGINNEDVRLSKRKSLSSTRMRGFKKNKIGPKDGVDHVGGNYAAAINFEANLPNVLPESSKADVGFFLDFGNVWSVDYDDTIDDSNTIRSSTGAVLNWLSPIGPMSFVLSTNLSKASTDETQSFKFNLGTTF